MHLHLSRRKCMNDIAGFYGAVDEAVFTKKARDLADKFNRFEARLESRLGGGAYFDGERCSPPCRPTTTAGFRRFSRRGIQNCRASWPPSATTGLKTGLAGRKRRRTP